MKGVIVDAALEGLPFIRLYLTEADAGHNLAEAAQRYEYVYAYSLVDLGEVESFSREQKWTQLINLDGSSDEVFAGLNKNNRSKVKRTYGVESLSVVVDDPARDESYAFYRTVKEADGVLPDIEEDFSSVVWMNAYLGGELTSSTCWFDSSAVLRAKHIVSTRKEQGADPNLVGRLTRRLFWEACAFGIEKGHRYVDLGGLDTTDPDKRGITEFKQSFGGETIPVYVYRRATEGWRNVSERALEDGLVVV